MFFYHPQRTTAYEVNNSAGFSLIELLTVLAVIGILATIAYPSYQDYIRKGRRGDGESILLDIAARQERNLYKNGAYTVDLTDLNFSASSNLSSTNGHYRVSVIAATVACPISTCYVLRATPQGSQASDGIMELTSTGIKRRDKNDDGDVTDGGEDSWSN